MAEIFNLWSLYEAAHLLNRAGFGGTPAEIKALHARGRENAVDWLLAAEESQEFPEPAWVEVNEEEEAEIIANRERIKSLPQEEQAKARFEAQRKNRNRIRSREASLFGWWMERMRKTDAPLQEKMVFFWHDHFATSSRKVRLPRLLYRQNQLFREESLGNFGKLTHQVALDPAMMSEPSLVIA